MLGLKNAAQARVLYDGARKWFTLIPLFVAFPATFFIDAGFGRFSPGGNSRFMIDGIKAWIFMELVAPITFIYTYLHSPLNARAFNTPGPLSLSAPPALLALLYLAHYANRALVSPLRTPSRAKSHLSVPLAAVSFNLTNGFLLAAYLSAPAARAHLAGAYARPRFWAGLALWAAGLAGNVLHDEVLLSLRRQTRKSAEKGKGKEGAEKPHYAIPRGYLYRWISYPNYFCEWCEWTGWALAAAPAPSVASWGAFMATLEPPWIFVITSVLVMLPRAVRGHKWYHDKFPDYPKERKAVIPFVL